MITGREEEVRKVMDETECSLTLLGATGVEDLLQEGVPETLEKLSIAGIKVVQDLGIVSLHPFILYF